MRCWIFPNRVFSAFPHELTTVLPQVAEQVAPFHGTAVWGTTRICDAAVSNKWIGSSTSASGSVHDGSGWGSGSPRSKAVSAPMAIKARAAHKVVGEARAQLEQSQAHQQSAGDEPEKRGPGRPPKAPVSLEQAEQALEAASRKHERLAQQREQVSKSIRAIGHAYHFVDLERGVRRNGQLIANDIQEHIEQVRAIAQHAGLSQTC